MDERVRFIADWLDKVWSLVELAERYGISRKTAYKWVRRYEKAGLRGLEDVSRAPKRHGNATPVDIEARLVAFRQRHPHWGPRKLIHRLRALYSETAWPASSTAGAILKRHGLVEARRRRPKTPAYNEALRISQRPNDVWAADFKGWFRTKNGTRVDPLTITDQASRYLLCCRGMVGPDTEAVQAEFETAFSEFGLPWAIRTDNGVPFASTGLGGLSRLAVWWIRLGIMPERIRPSHPEENGRHERMHRTLKQETTQPPSANLPSQQTAFDRFRAEYNDERPHEALGMQTPGHHYKASDRRFPSRLPEIEYGPGFSVRQVRYNGTIKWQGDPINISKALIGQPVGLSLIGNDRWAIYFGPLKLAEYDLISRGLQPT